MIEAGKKYDFYQKVTVDVYHVDKATQTRAV